MNGKIRLWLTVQLRVSRFLFFGDRPCIPGEIDVALPPMEYKIDQVGNTRAVTRDDDLFKRLDPHRQKGLDSGEILIYHLQSNHSSAPFSTRAGCTRPFPFDLNRCGEHLNSSGVTLMNRRRSEERRVGKECRS